MAGWRTKTNGIGEDVAFIKIVLDSVIIEGKVVLDNEKVSWSVKDNGNLIAQGDIAVKKGGDVEDNKTIAWDEALSQATKAIIKDNRAPSEKKKAPRKKQPA